MMLLTKAVMMKVLQKVLVVISLINLVTAGLYINALHIQVSPYWYALIW